MTEFVHDYYCRRLGFVAGLSNCAGKIWIFWDHNFRVELLRDEVQLLHVRCISGLFGAPFVFTAVYARCSRSERRVLWNSFRDIFETIGDTPWISGGDFNSILLESERNRSVSDRRLDMAEFGAMVSDCELLDAGFSGASSCYSWESPSGTHLSRTWSDHAPLLVSSAASSSRPPASFRFQHMWIRHATFRQIVEQVWDFPCAQTGMHRLHTKLRRLKQKLQWWNWNVFGDVFKNKERAEAAVLEAEHIYDLDRSPENRANLKKATAELTLMLNIEEDFWKQKAACRWATDGERNSKFFHSLVKKKRCVNRIHSISHGDLVLTSAQEIKDSGVDFFSKLLTNDMPSLLPVDESLFSAPQRDFSSVSTRPSVEEIKDAVFGICRDSASGPDGYSSLFYQHCWDLIQCDVCEAVWDFFEGGSMPASFTATTLVLIPKVDFPTAWTDFRPISLCNVTNKIITKVLTNRLAPHLPHIISPSQSGFVQGRLISDNILLAQEMVHLISVRCRNPNLILKLDMAKAYDRVQWRFLFRVLELMGFSANLVDIIRRCVSSCQFSLLINGELTGYFTSSRGLRQGDPLSPTLFVLAAEYFSRGLDALYSRCPSMFYSTRGGIPISHLAYADDVMIFTSCHNFGLKKLRDFLDHYCRTSGQLISVHKSTFTVDRACSDGHLRTISRILSYPRKDLPIIYLGAPLYKGRDRGSLFHTLLDRMQARISGWARTALAFGGRLALIRSTLSTMALHLVQVIQPPQYIIQQIEQCMARFLWGSYGNQRRPHWVAWETICRPVGEGGLGLRRLTDVIDAFTYKLWFRFRAQDSLWARFLRNKYCRNRFPGSSVVSSLYSTVWKRMCRVRERVQAQIFWRIGPGHVYFWHDHWFGDGPLSGIIDGGRLTSVRVEYYLVNGQWDRNKLAEDIPFEWIDRICSVPISGASGDLPIWRASSDGKFSLTSAWALIRQQHTPTPLLRIFWGSCLTPTISIFLWRLLLQRLPVDTKLQSRGTSLASRCYCCPDPSIPVSSLVSQSVESPSVESIDHIFVESPTAKRVWHHFFYLFGYTPAHTTHIPQILLYWQHFTSHTLTHHTHITTIVPCLILWYLWIARNDSKHKDITVRASSIIYRVIQHIRILHQTNLLSADSWTGIPHMAESLGLYYRVGTPTLTPHRVVWLPPDPGWVKLNTNGARRASTQIAAIGGIIRGSDAEAIVAFHERISAPSSIAAELAALASGLRFVIQRQFTRVWIELDAEVAVRLLSHTDQGHWSLQSSLTAIRNSLSTLEYRITHIYREGNKVADALANLGCQTELARTFTTAELPRPIQQMIRMDQLGYPSFRRQSRT
ncbi:PREDICTED: uncharacterized protein LOC105969825 [Erythranthe guttata]|uniref:uncharacterized protein LOC105969825 n=1 Tax=Erythranthe guttata TaxID=4155 RepID=UPI00064DFBB5|nr:PREDICTED: uncharacterized protein LOC105969825 [Erythranthe guttata]|eukprot:XP_012850055.1 PREDICTED: uncharacterized protein LOC105969825 [Erythranthe guttata]